MTGDELRAMAARYDDLAKSDPRAAYQMLAGSLEARAAMCDEQEAS